MIPSGETLGDHPSPQHQAGGGAGIPSDDTLLLAAPIVDNAGAEVGTLGQLLQRFNNLAQKNTLLHEQLEALLADIMSQGGMVLDRLCFLLEAHAKEVVLKEYPIEDAFEVFFDVMLLFCCNPAYVPAIGWEKFNHSIWRTTTPLLRARWFNLTIRHIVLGMQRASQ